MSRIEQAEIALSIASAEAMEQLGARLAAKLPRGVMVYLRGDLGAGKTTLVRGFLRGLGYQGVVRSPTYTLLEPYCVAGVEVLHLDLYRLSNPEELAYIGIRDLATEQTICFVEWPERGTGLLPPADLIIDFSYDSDRRELVLRADRSCRRAIEPLKFNNL